MVIFSLRNRMSYEEKRALGEKFIKDVNLGAYDEVTTFLNNKGDVDFRDTGQNTALIIAARNCDEKMIVLLVESGANVNLRNMYGVTATDDAWNQNKETGFRIAVYLEEHGGTASPAYDATRGMYKQSLIDNDITIAHDLCKKANDEITALGRGARRMKD